MKRYYIIRFNDLSTKKQNEIKADLAHIQERAINEAWCELEVSAGPADLIDSSVDAKLEV